MITTTLLSWAVPPAPIPRKPTNAIKIPVRAFKYLTPQAFSSMWVSCQSPLLSPDDQDAILHTKLVLARNQFCPLHLVTPKNPTHLKNKWFTPALKKIQTAGRAIYRAWSKSHSRTDLIRWQKHQQFYKLSLKRAKQAFVQSRIQSAKNSSRELFNLTKALSTVPCPQSPPQAISKDFVDGLARFFTDKVTNIRSELETLGSDPELSSAQAFLAARTSLNVAASSSSSGISAPLAPAPTPPLDTSSSSTALFSSPLSVVQPTFTAFLPVSQDEVRSAILKLGPSSSVLDPLPTSIIKTLVDFLLPDITNLINTSLREGIVPLAWKKGVVTPLLKKPGADPSDFKNYRPITQLRLLARLIEYFVTQQLQNHLERHNLLHEYQSGFRPGRGTEVALADVREWLLCNADQHHPSLLVLLDLSAAFDTVDHSILSSRLTEVAGITGVAHKWIVSFLSKRSQLVRLGEIRSEEVPVSFGVPQGSSLSPLLFNLYLRPLATLLDSIGLPFHCYADDTQLLVDLHESAGQGASLTPALLLIQDWMRTNKLKLNGDKTELLGVPSARGGTIPSVPWPVSWGPPPPVSTKVRDLGVMISHTLGGEAHATGVSGACHGHLGALTKIFPLLTRPQKVALYHAFIGSRLSYGLAFLLGATAKTIFLLQKVQNRAIRAIFNLNWRAHISPWRAKLGWLSIKSLITFKICIWLWKSKHAQGPLYLRNWLRPRSAHHPLRSLHENKLCLAPARKAGKGGRTIAHKGAALWNLLPPTLRSQPSLAQFKSVLKKHLLASEAPLTQVPTPPTSRLSPGTITSLLDSLTSFPPLSGTPPLDIGPSSSVFPVSFDPVTDETDSSHNHLLKDPSLLDPPACSIPIPSTSGSACLGDPLVPPHPPPETRASLGRLTIFGKSLLNPRSHPPGWPATGPRGSGPRGLSSPPLPLRNNLTLINRAIRNKERLKASGHYR